MMYSTKIDNDETAWMRETGKLPIPMTNDYLFKAVNQENEDALKSLICALLHKSEEEISSIRVCNPIMLGKAVDEKEYILDIRVELNDSAEIDMEMQVINYHDWPERSLQYLCRTFDSLHRGETYLDSKEAIHIGILDFLLDESSPLLESYRLTGSKTGRIYTEKFQLHILSLPKLHEPDEKDTLYHTDLWAGFFTATTWEELKMLAQKDEGVAGAVMTAHRLYADDDIKARALARDDYIRRQKTEQAKLSAAQEAMLAAKEKADAEAKRADAEAKRADAEARRADDEARRADDEAKRADDEAKRADDEARRADDEARRADRAEARIKELEETIRSIKR